MKIPKFLRIILFLLVLPLCGAFGPRSASAVEYPEDIAARIQKKYDEMTSLTFTFKQKSQGQVSGRPQSGGGTAYFYKKGSTSRMRWNYSEPDRQVLISDGKTFSMYFENLHQMIVTPAESLDSDLTYTFFSGRGRIAEKFYILPPDQEYMQEAGDGNKPKIIKLVPREPQSQVQSIHLWVGADSLIRRIEIRDQFDTITMLNLSDIKVDSLGGGSGAMKELFSFTPPAGTEIIHQ